MKFLCNFQTSDDDNIDDLLYSMDDLGRLSPPILDLDVDLAM
jgi:hypothetical protein